MSEDKNEKIDEFMFKTFKKTFEDIIDFSNELVSEKIKGVVVEQIGPEAHSFTPVSEPLSWEDYVFAACLLMSLPLS